MEPDLQDYQFDKIEVRRRTFEVWKRGTLLPLEPKSIRLLLYLIANRDRTVSKEEIFNAVWTGTAVSDNALTRVVAQLRRELGDDARQPRYIQTVPTLGYRFIAPLDAPAVPPRPRRRYVYAAAVVFLCAAVGIWIAFQSRTAAAWPTEMRTSGSLQLTTSSGLDISPSYSPDGASMAYATDRSGRFEICIRPPGGREIQLTADGAQNIQPAWSPDAKSIAFHSVAKGGIWLIPSAGGAARQLTRSGSQPAWSPDGRRLAFRSEDVFSLSANDLFSNVSSSISVVSATGGDLEPLTQPGHPAGRHLFPSWSPDGRRILFSVQTGNAAELWSVQPGGSQPARLASADGSVYIAPVYSPQGDAIYYGAMAKTHEFGIWKVPLSDGGLRAGEWPVEIVHTGTSIPRDLALSHDGKRLAYTLSMAHSSLWTLDPAKPDKSSPLYKDVVYRTSSPIFSPDGRHIAFFVRVFGGRGDVWTMNADGSGASPLASSGADMMMPSWTPDGSAVVLTRDTGQGAQLYEVSVAARSEKPLLNGQPVMGWSRLSPDGKELVYQARRQGIINIWSLSMSSGKSRQLTNDPESAGFPAWSPDGRSLVYELFRGPNTYLAIMDRDGSHQKQLNSDPGHSWAFSFSPDSRKIVYAGLRQGTWNLWTFDRGTSRQVKLTDNVSLAAYVRYPAWSPDGKQIVFEHSITRGNIYETPLH
ncbi:MAG: winged helix-turn-helix domain-containing protein [Bryobacteraceae bacterium]